MRPISTTHNNTYSHDYTNILRLEVIGIKKDLPIAATQRKISVGMNGLWLRKSVIRFQSTRIFHLFVYRQYWLFLNQHHYK